MRGDIVIVRTFGGKPAERRVWDTNDSLVYVTTDEEFAKLVVGKPALQPVGFPKEDVFCRPAKKFTLKHINWSRLVQWPD